MPTTAAQAQTDLAAITREYLVAFNRLPDQTGAIYWTHALENGTPLSQISIDFTNSTEFSTSHYLQANANTPASAVWFFPANYTGPANVIEEFYLSAFGREADQAGESYWQNSGLDTAQLLTAFSQAPEAIAHLQGSVTGFENQMAAAGFLV
jgi:hypothetical protein